MMYILHQQDKVPIRIQSKKSSLPLIFFHNFCLRRSFVTKKSCLQRFFDIQKTCLWGIWFQCLLYFTDSLVLKMIRIQKLVCELTETIEEKCFYWHNLSHSAELWRWRQTALKQRVSLRGVYVWNVNSTVTKHSDYFVWKDTSERDSTFKRHQLTRSEWILVY